MGLLLVTTPIGETGELTPGVRELLLSHFNKGHTLLVEDIKPARRRWRAWDLPREAIEVFVAYNEHSRDRLDDELISRLKSGEEMILMSDGGTPGFCDPGRSLIEKCHQSQVKVSITESCNSLIPAVALSGFTEGAFEFLGFPPRDKDERKAFFKELFKKKTCQVFMDTPYRLDRVVSEVIEAQGQEGRRHCIVMDINRDSEEIFWGSLKELKKAREMGKREFLWVIEPLS